jgi:hypothetical protein
MAERNDNGETERLAREVKGLLGVKTQDGDTATRVAPLNSLVDGERKTAMRDQVRLMASALGLTVSEYEADAHAATLLGLVAAEKASGVGNRAVAAHLLTASARRHAGVMERIAVALESLARGKGQDEPAQRVSGAAATYSAQQIADLRTLADMIEEGEPMIAGKWTCGAASAERPYGHGLIITLRNFDGEVEHLIKQAAHIRFRPPSPPSLVWAWVAATCRALATQAEASITAARSLDELVALELEGTR